MKRQTIFSAQVQIKVAILLMVFSFVYHSTLYAHPLSKSDISMERTVLSRLHSHHILLDEGVLEEGNDVDAAVLLDISLPQCEALNLQDLACLSLNHPDVFHPDVAHTPTAIALYVLYHRLKIFA